ncbi:MAG: LPXTG-motif cell wall anchor domain protein, partial [Eubacterium sp.]|nr:LPXTG-motif cell wall anchor domain protein [Eubacterium sp.]
NGNTAVKASLSRNTIQNNPIPKVIFGSVIVTKTADDGRLLAGAHFTIYDVNETAVQFGVSGQDGKALFNNLVPGQYTIRETEAPEGYELNNTDFQVIVLGNDTKEVTVVNKLKKIPDPGTNTPGNGTNTPGNGTNTPGNGTNTPGNGTNTPGNGTNTPGNGTNTPGNGTNTPEPDTDTPDTSAPKINEKTASISISKIDGRSRKANRRRGIFCYGFKREYHCCSCFG